MAMKSSGKLGVILLVLTFLTIAFVDITRDRQIDWTRTYDQRDKIPYGLFFTRTELPKILGKEVKVRDFTAMNYPDLKSFLRGKEKGSLVYIVDGMYDGKEAVAELVAYVERGGEVFISTNSLSIALLDTLGLRQEYYYPQNFNDAVDIDDRPFMLTDGTKAFYKDLDYPGLFYEIDSVGISKIGYFQAEDREVPNFVEVQRKKGRFLLHLEPLMFTNYYMLKRANYNYAATALKLLKRRDVFWYDARAKSNDAVQTPLRVLLQNEGLKQAWYILLFGLIMFLLFRSKREQMAIPVIEPEKNLSKEFAKTIANLYYESDNPGNLVQKKIEYFLYDLRTNFLLDTLTLDEPRFAAQLSAKTGVPLADCEYIIALVLRYRKGTATTDRELIEVNKQIEEFKNKANIL